MIGTHPRRGTNSRCEGTPTFTLQVDAEAMSVLGMLQQEPGAVEWLLTGCTSVAAWLIFTFKRQRKRLQLVHPVRHRKWELKLNLL